MIHNFKLFVASYIMESGEGEEVSIEELASNLSTYREQLQQVRKLLNDDPKNSEFSDMEKELVEVIALTEELLETANQDSNSGLGIVTSGEVSPIDAEASESEQEATAPCGDGGGRSEDGMNVHDLVETVLTLSPPSQSLFRKSRSTADYGDKFTMGTKVQAVWSGDGEWYNATIEALTPNGYYVRYDGWGNREEVDPDNVRPISEDNADPLLEAEKIAVATKESLKRKIALAASKDSESWTVPPKLQIDPNDPEDVKATKRKKIHAFKSKMRMEAKEVTQNKRQNAWQQFQTTKGKAKKVGFFSGRKRESIFKSPEDPFGKVGVTGSGKGLTEFQRREKHLHLKGANIEIADGGNIDTAD
ncbi:hypothetical protein BUALT_Bualt15G0097000 [Buddleja alternifolia]|uniref:Tudor domain-containing protein n=1 Tax=Buddleja alternifolia TaxID=168488 RepID=A0AAV6WDX1_9LAMI|nr:hypothetical protein BUALT_Bualt15G0097000 [Buddleja alternifolia]